MVLAPGGGEGASGRPGCVVAAVEGSSMDSVWRGVLARWGGPLASRGGRATPTDQGCCVLEVRVGREGWGVPTFPPLTWRVQPVECAQSPNSTLGHWHACWSVLVDVKQILSVYFTWVKKDSTRRHPERQKKNENGGGRGKKSEIFSGPPEGSAEEGSGVGWSDAGLSRGVQTNNNHINHNHNHNNTNTARNGGWRPNPELVWGSLSPGIGWTFGVQKIWSKH